MAILPNLFHSNNNTAATDMEQQEPINPAQAKLGVGLPRSNGSDVSVNRIRKDTIGYKPTAFPLKEEQRKEVERIVLAQGFLPRELVAGEVNWFYASLGIDNTYFLGETASVIADHILAIYSAKLLAYTKHDPTKLTIDLESITSEEASIKGGGKRKEGAVWIHSSVPGLSASEGPGAYVEKRIDEMYLDKATVDRCFRLETYRSTGSVSSSAPQQLRCYFVNRCVWAQAPPVIDPGSTNITKDIRTVSDVGFLEKASENTLEVYQQVMNEVEKRSGPVIELFEVEESRERRIVVGYKMGSTSKFFSALSDLYHFYGLYSARKYVECFSNGIVIISMYLNPVPNTTAPPIQHSIVQVVKETSLLYCLPGNPFFSAKAATGASHAVQEATYAYVGWIFAQHFCNRLGPSFLALKGILDESNPSHAQVLSSIKNRFREETFTRQFIQETLQAYPDIVRMLYINFAMIHYPAADEASQLTPTLSFQRLKTEQPLSDSDLLLHIRKKVTDEHAAQVLESLLVFNKHVLKTNFYQPTKVALSFRLDPSFLPTLEYPVKPFGIFFVIGNDFRGFHCRFRDIARGGVRIIRSRGKEDYGKNARRLFDEAYGLSSTQQQKNCLIVEGGSKATILPDIDANLGLCFEKFADSIIDLLIPGQTPGVKEKIVDISGRTTPEVLFFGPDENTADQMDHICLLAKKRGAPWWKSFTTGKGANTLGGIPHDVYGMTSLSVRQFILGIYRTHGLKESNVVKTQIGGPDGDLGSNEILLSSDKTATIVDGSGTLHDPNGLDRKEITRLAKERKPVSFFDKSKLGKGGYLVLLDDKNVTLPSGEVVQDGMVFRNNAHFHFKSDIFVPCGGRPQAVNITNVNRLFDSEGRPHFKYICEGANLFITQEARIYLEKRGVEIYKDQSCNKGGVTSSSLEVLSGLALNDKEFSELMTFKDEPSAFYKSYVEDIKAVISYNAAQEFDVMGAEFSRQKGKVPRSQISDQLAQTLIGLRDELEASGLYADKSTRSILEKALPKTLVTKLGLDVILERLPESYLKALWGVYVASQFVFRHGMAATQVDFYRFYRGLAAAAEAESSA